MRESNYKKDRVSEKILFDINTLVRQQNDPRLQFISFTRLEVSSDYSVAKVYWDTFQPERKKTIAQALNSLAPRLRSLIGKNLKLRHTPELIFRFDSQYEDEHRIADLLRTETSPANSGDDS